MMRECPLRATGSMTRPTGSVVALSSSGVQLIGRGRGARGAANSGRIWDHTYALADLQTLEVFPNVDTGTTFIFLHKVYALIDPYPILSYATPWIVKKK